MSKYQATEGFIALLHRVGFLKVDDQTKTIVRDAIREVAFEHDVSGLERFDQLELARKLLGSGTDIPVIRDRLMHAFGFSRATAYRIIEESIGPSHEVRDFETQKESN